MNKNSSRSYLTRGIGLLPVVALWLAQALPSAALAAPLPSCTSTFNLNALGPPASASLGNSFNNGVLFSDCYNFSINAVADSTGSTAEVNSSFWFLPRYIDVLTVSLFYVPTGTKIGTTDVSPSAFAFNSLLAGAYRLQVGGYATMGFGTASYSGTLNTTAARVVTQVPEPSTLALLATAIFGLALARRRILRN